MPRRDRAQHELVRRLVSYVLNLIKNEPVAFTDNFSRNAQSLISGLLRKDAKRRLGSDSLDQIKSHPFFKPINWEKLYNLEIPAPIIPKVHDAEDTSNFDRRITKQSAIP